jgi:hypothetical protein
MKQLAIMAFVAALLIAASSITSAAPRPADAAAAAVERRPVKPGGPIAVDYELAAQPVVGTPLEVAVTAHVELGVTNVTLEAHPSVPRAVLVTVPELLATADRTYSWRVTAVPLAEDAGYLTIVVSGTADGVAQSRSVTVALGSAAQPGAPPAAVSPGEPAEGEALIALPVQESP